ncbi:TetR/AcrR family transcriptional regulator [Micromonosporaceae bacterium Da 78-11]
MSSKVTPPRGVGRHYQGNLHRTLLDSAAELWAARDADGVSLREVARHAGVSHAAPAHHFGDRAGLLTALATEGFLLFTEHLRSALADHAEPPAARLPQLGQSYAEFAERHPGHFAVMFRPGLLHMTDPALIEASATAFATLRGHIERCQQAGWRPDADATQLAAASWALAHGITALRMQGTLARHYPDDSLDGVGALVRALID